MVVGWWRRVVVGWWRNVGEGCWWDGDRGWWDGGGGRLSVIMIHFPADLFYSSARQGENSVNC